MAPSIGSVEQFAWMRTLAGFVILPMLLVAAISAVVHQDPTRLLRAVGVDLPLAVVGTAVAIELTNRALQLTDLLSNQVSASLGGNVQQSLDAVIKAMDGLAGAGSAAGGFVLMIGTLLVAFGALLVWIELLVRASAISVAVLFLPLALSGLLAATARWAGAWWRSSSPSSCRSSSSSRSSAWPGDAVQRGWPGLHPGRGGPPAHGRIRPFRLAAVSSDCRGGSDRSFRGVGASTRQRCRRSRHTGRGTVGSGAGFTAGAAGFASESGLAPALGTVLPDPMASTFAPSFTDLGGGDAGTRSPATGSPSSTTGHSRAVTPIGPVGSARGRTAVEGEASAVRIGTTMRRSSPVPTDDGEPRRYTFPPLERRGVVLGLGSAQLTLVALASLIAVMTIRVMPTLGGVLVASGRCRGRRCRDLLASGGTATIGVVALAGPMGMAFGGPGWQHSSGAAVTTGAAQLRVNPALLGVRILSASVPPGADDLGVIKDVRMGVYAVVVSLRGRWFTLLDPTDKQRRLAAWGAVLAGLGRDGSPIHRVQWIERAIPGDRDGLAVPGGRSGPPLRTLPRQLSGPRCRCRYGRPAP